jgi:hypothetical protein
MPPWTALLLAGILLRAAGWTGLRRSATRAPGGPLYASGQRPLLGGPAPLLLPLLASAAKALHSGGLSYAHAPNFRLPPSDAGACRPVLPPLACSGCTGLAESDHTCYPAGGSLLPIVRQCRPLRASPPRHRVTACWSSSCPPGASGSSRSGDVPPDIGEWNPSRGLKWRIQVPHRKTPPAVRRPGQRAGASGVARELVGRRLEDE